MITSIYHMTVPFYDVDSMQVVWHGNYVKYLELARVQLLAELGYSYQSMLDTGLVFPVVDLQIRYIGPLRYQQAVEIVTSLSEWEYRLKIAYKILDATTKKCLTKAYTIQVALRQETSEILLGIPDNIKQRIQEKLSTVA